MATACWTRRLLIYLTALYHSFHLCWHLGSTDRQCVASKQWRTFAVFTFTDSLYRRPQLLAPGSQPFYLPCGLLHSPRASVYEPTAPVRRRSTLSCPCSFLRTNPLYTPDPLVLLLRRLQDPSITGADYQVRYTATQGLLVSARDPDKPVICPHLLTPSPSTPNKHA
jgi:hypothetical protein